MPSSIAIPYATVVPTPTPTPKQRGHQH
jgi:hypothetical protein